jgi:uncharacterized protein (TIGR03437 family)
LTPTSGLSTPLSVPVALTVTAAPQVTASPASLAFNYQIGGTNNVLQQLVSLTSTGAPLTFGAPSVSAVWLVATASGSVTPATLTVGLQTASLTQPGTYTGSVSLSVSGAPPLVIPVKVTVSTSPLLTATPATLTFTYQTGTGIPPAQNIALATTGADVSYTAAASTTIGGSWLTATGGASTPNPVSVSINPAGLLAGVYSGTVTITAPAAGNSPQQVGVTLTVTNNPFGEATPSALSFAYQIGRSVPAGQAVTVTSSTGATLNYTVTTATTGGGNWLSAGPSSGSTPGTFNVTVVTNGLTPGAYQGTVTITLTNPTGAPVPNSPLTIPVTYYVSNDALLQVSPSALAFTATSGGAANPEIESLTSTSDALNYTIAFQTNSGGPWLSVSAQTGTTPGNFFVSAVGPAAGTYTGSITITATNPSGAPVANSPVIIPVTLQVVASAISVAPTSLTFTQSQGGPAPASQTLSVSGTGTVPLNFTAAASNVSGVNWLTVTPTSGSTPATLTVSADGTNLSQGTYNGTITIVSPGAAGSPQTVPVTLTVTAAPTISLTPASLTFSYAGGAAPGGQSVQVTSSSGALAFTAAATTNANSGNWLSVTPASGTTPGTLTVTVNPINLAIGSYTGTVTVTSTGAANSPQSVTVSLTVTSLPTISATPAGLTFSYAGGTAPAAQNVQVTSSGGALTFTAAATTSGNSGNWLSVTPAGGTTPGTLSVAVNPGSLAGGTYSGTVTVTSTAAGNSPLSVPVTLTVASSTVLPTAVTNAASGVVGPIAAGEIISIFGSNLGPTKGVFGTITNNSLSTEVAGVQVKFDNNYAPLLYVSATQINALVPFEVNSLFHTNMQVVNGTTVSNALDLAVAPTAPGIFTATETGSGQGSILNQDGSVNNSSNPAAQGSIIVLFATGGGQTQPPGVTGNITPPDGTGLKNVPGVTVTIAGQEGTVIYAGSAPAFVEGAMQINVQMPATVPSGAQPVVVTVGGASSQINVTVAVQ